MSAERKYVHVAFDRTTCPIPGCTSGKGGTPQTGSVPGIKRHVKLVHGKAAYESAKFPKLRTATGPINDLPKQTLLEAAKIRHVIPADTPKDKLTKHDLIEALTK